MPWLKILKYGLPALVLAALGILAQRAVVGYGDGRVRAAVRPWQDAQTAWKARAAAQDETNLAINAKVEEDNERERRRIAGELADTQRLLVQARDRGRRVEEAYRLALADERGRVAASSATVARLLEDIGRARGEVDSSSAAYDAACRKDAITLTGLQTEIRPWVILQ
jgi:signal transduction histidine kinase